MWVESDHYPSRKGGKTTTKRPEKPFGPALKFKF
jgi:hypothetical protein